MRGRDRDMAETGSVHATRFEAAVKVIQSLPKNGKCGLGTARRKVGDTGPAARLALVRWQRPGTERLCCRRPLLRASGTRAGAVVRAPE